MNVRLLATALVLCASIHGSALAAPLPPLTVAGCSLPNHDLATAWQTVLDLGFSGVEIAVFPEKENGEVWSRPRGLFSSFKMLSAGGEAE